jgi:hypothetical protein
MATNCDLFPPNKGVSTPKKRATHACSWMAMIWMALYPSRRMRGSTSSLNSR